MVEIVDIRKMTDEEMEQEGWYGRVANPTILELDNGDMLYPSSDPEGNSAGAFFGRTSDGEAFHLEP